MRNIEEIRDVKEKLLLTNVKYLWLSLNRSWTLLFCILNMRTISKVIGINEEEESVCQTGNT